MSYYRPGMEQELRANLRSCADAFALARGLEVSTVGRLAANDGRFFERIEAGSSFTARKYDETIRWFAGNWPSNAEWPAHVARPAGAVADVSAACESAGVA